MAKLEINVLREKTKNGIQLPSKDELPVPIRFFSVFHCRLVRTCAHVYKFMHDPIVFAHRIHARCYKKNERSQQQIHFKKYIIYNTFLCSSSNNPADCFV